MLLVAAWRRLLIAGVAVATLWAAVLWVAPSTPSTAPAQPSARVTAPPPVLAAETGALRAVVRSGVGAPGGGRFDRFDITSQPIVAPVNARGQVAFFATVLRSPAREGIFLAEAGQVSKVAAFGDNLSGGGTLAEFAVHPLPVQPDTELVHVQSSLDPRRFWSRIRCRAAFTCPPPADAGCTFLTPAVEPLHARAVPAHDCGRH